MVYLPLSHVCHKVWTDQHPGVCTATSSRQTVCPTAVMNSVNQHAVVHASAMRITPVAYSKSSNPQWHRSWGANNKECCISHYALAAVMLIGFCELWRSRNGISFRLSQGHVTQLGKTCFKRRVFVLLLFCEFCLLFLSFVQKLNQVQLEVKGTVPGCYHARRCSLFNVISNGNYNQTGVIEYLLTCYLVGVMSKIFFEHVTTNPQPYLNSTVTSLLRNIVCHFILCSYCEFEHLFCLMGEKTLLL